MARRVRSHHNRAAWISLVLCFPSPSHLISAFAVSRRRSCSTTEVVCWNANAAADDTLDDDDDDTTAGGGSSGAVVVDNASLLLLLLSSSTHDIAVLYEDDRVLVINKPEGIAHHDQEGGELGILSVVRHAQAFGTLDYQGRIYGVHRLDRVTSGILMLAKDADTASTLTRAFREGTVVKYYVGLSTKQRTLRKKKQGWVKGNMKRGRRKSWYLTRETDGDASNVAVTRFFTASLSSLRDDGAVAAQQQDDLFYYPMTCLLFRPHTGRTHQLRVAAKSLGMPLLGDPIYKDGRLFDSTTAAAAACRTCLHACAIHVDLDDGPITIWSPPPFHHLWKTKASQEAFDAILIHLMQKYCDCGPILDKMNGPGQ